MKKLTIFSLIIIAFFCSCNRKTAELQVKNKIVISGEVINYDKKSGKNIITVYINDNGKATQLNYPAKIDSTGHFHIQFERYYPQDVMISYKTNFRAIVHPGDSLYVEFNGNTRQRTEIFNTLKFSGNAANLNAQLAKYLRNYFETRPSTRFIHQQEKKLTGKEYIKFQDSIKLARETYRNQFVQENKPDQELIDWINADIQYSYYEKLLQYPGRHKKFNQLAKDWKIEESYYRFVETIPPVSLNDLIYSGIRWFTSEFLYSYIWDIAWSKADNQSKSNIDSLMFYKTIELAPQQGLIKQLALNDLINKSLDAYEISFYKKNKQQIHNQITEHCLIEPIQNHYTEIKKLIEQPVLATEIELHENVDKTASELWTTILGENKGKVIYIDCWATWCGACISESPNSKKMMKEYKDKEVAFVFLCFKSDQTKWKQLLAEQQLEGKHYFLNDEQSAFFTKTLHVNSFPNYAIIDKKGHIIRNGSMFRPSQAETENIINSLL